MKRTIQKIFLFFTFLFFIQCSNIEVSDTSKPKFTFAIGGHVYGHPDRYTSSVYPGFLKQLDSLNLIEPIDLLILTGDVVAHPTKENWETVKSELDSLKVEWHIAPGNHDISDYMDQEIQPYKYIAIEKEQNLFLVLNTSHPGWKPDSLQLIFIKESLTNVDSMENVFVFTHQLWWEKNPPVVFELDSIRPNSFAGFESDRSFWDEAFPYFENINKDVYFFAGDVGCHEGLTASYEDHYKNFHFYASGMGGGLEDNFLLVHIFQDGIVEIQRIDF